MPGFRRSRRVCCSEEYCLQRSLWREINAFTEQLTSTTQMEDININLLSLLPVRLINVVAKTPDVTARQPKLYAAA